MGVLSHFKEGKKEGGVELTVLTKNNSAMDSVRVVCFELFWGEKGGFHCFLFPPHAFFFVQCKHCNPHASITSTTYFFLRLCGLNSGARTCQFNPCPQTYPHT